MNKWLEGQETLGATVNGIRLVRYSDIPTTYKCTSDNTHYTENTPDEIIKVLERLRQSGQRIRVHYGNTKTGKDYGEIYDVTGTIGRTTGRHAPILVYNGRSLGGGVILTEMVVKITETRKPHRVIYQHPTYHE